MGEKLKQILLLEIKWHNYRIKKLSLKDFCFIKGGQPHSLSGDSAFWEQCIHIRTVPFTLRRIFTRQVAPADPAEPSQSQVFVLMLLVFISKRAHQQKAAAPERLTSWSDRLPSSKALHPQLLQECKMRHQVTVQMFSHYCPEESGPCLRYIAHVFKEYSRRDPHLSQE